MYVLSNHMLKIAGLIILFAVPITVSAAQDPIGATLSPATGFPATTKIGESYTVIYTLKNNLLFPEPLKQVVSTTKGSGFSIVDKCSNTTLSANGGTCPITITFQPTNYGNASIQLTMQYDNNVVPLPAISTTVGATPVPIQWSTCKDASTFECGMLTVPIDYQDATVGTLQLPVIIHPQC